MTQTLECQLLQGGGSSTEKNFFFKGTKRIGEKMAGKMCRSEASLPWASPSLSVYRTEGRNSRTHYSHLPCRLSNDTILMEFPCGLVVKDQALVLLWCALGPWPAAGTAQKKVAGRTWV